MIRTWVWDRVLCQWVLRMLTPAEWGAMPHVVYRAGECVRGALAPGAVAPIIPAAIAGHSGGNLIGPLSYLGPLYISGTVDHMYTPVVAVPEPNTFVLLLGIAIGVIAVDILRRLK